MPARTRPFLMHALALVLLLAASGAPVLARQDAPAPGDTTEAPEPAGPPPGLESPRDTARTFFDTMERWQGEGDDALLDDAMRCLDLSGLPFASEVGADLAVRVSEAFESVGFSRWTRLPGRSQAERSGARVEVRAGTMRIVFVRGDDLGWRIAGQTVEALNDLYALENPDPLARLFVGAGAGALVSRDVLGVPAYQWIGVFLAILVGVVIDLLVRVVVQIVIRRYVRREGDSETRRDTGAMIRRAARPFGLTAGGLTVYALLHQFEIALQAAVVLKTAAKVFSLCAGVWSLYRLTDVLSEFFARKASRTDTRFDDLLVPLLRKTVKIFVVAFGLVFIADALDLPIASLLAGIGIGGLAFAFAAKDTIENLFGSVTVIFDRPFDVGDWVVVEGVEGIVEELGFRSTRVRTFYNSIVTVPNAALVRAKVDNYGRRRFRRFKTHLGLTYDTPPEKIEAFCEGIRDLVRTHDATRKDYFEVHLNRFGPHSLDVLVYMFFRVPDWSAELHARHAFMLDVLRLAESLGVEFAFPTQTLHVHSAPPGDSPGHQLPGATGR